MRSAFLGLFTLLLVASSKARADPAYDRCMDRASSSYAYNSCGQQWLKREEAALTVAWKHAFGSLTMSDAKASLLQEQRNWVKYKDSACGFFHSDEFGSMGWSQEMLPCIVEVVRARTRQLNEYADRFN